MPGNHMQRHRHNRGRTPCVNMPATDVLLIDAHYSFMEGIDRDQRERPTKSKRHFREQHRRLLPGVLGLLAFLESLSYSLMFFESSHTRTVFSRSFTETSSVSPCNDSARRPATRTSSSVPPENSASTTFMGTLTSTSDLFG